MCRAYFGWVSSLVKITAKRRNTDNFCIFRALDVFTGPTLALILSKYQRRPLQHIYMYRCKNNTIRFIILIFKTLNLSAADKRCKRLECEVFLHKMILIFHDLRIDSAGLEVKEASGMEIFA